MDDPYEGLNLIQLLDLLEPVPEPLPVSWMPQTAGWIWLGLAVVALILFGTRYLVARYRANRYRRAALVALDGAGADPARVATILRRTALAGFPRASVAGLTGANWLSFLDQTMQGNGFVSGPGQALTDAPYRATPPNPDLTALARKWVRQHVTSSGQQ